MNSFHDSLLAHYRELIHEAVVESEFDHKTQLDLNMFTQKINVVLQAAIIDGISRAEITELLIDEQRHGRHQFLAA